MMSPELVALVGFVALFFLLVMRVPIGVAMGVVGLGGFAAVTSIEPALNQLALAPIRSVTDYALTLIPMFILMGSVASASGMSNELYRAANAWLGHNRGGVAMSTVAACGGFSAICGSSVATAATMAKVALPEMKRFGYPDSMAAGVVAAGGTLGILIPPSIVLAIYGVLTEQDIGKLFVAGIVPGILAIILYIVTIRIVMALRGSSIPLQDRADWREKLTSLRDVWAIMLLFVFIIGGIYGGVFTPSEAAGMGASGAILISAARGKLGARRLFDCLVESIRISAAIFLILIGAVLFGYFLTITQVPQGIASTLVGWELGPYPTLILILGLLIVLGTILDAMAMIVLMVPILHPVALALGFDPIWFGIIMVMTVELALITPPVGMNIFVISGLAPGVGIHRIYAGVLPFVIADLLRIAVVIAFPAIVLYLPSTM